MTGAGIPDDQEPRSPGLSRPWELTGALALAVAGGVFADSQKPVATVRGNEIGGGLLLSFFLVVNAVHYFAHRRRDRSWTLRSYLGSQAPWIFLAVTFIGYLIVADPTALA